MAHEILVGGKRLDPREAAKGLLPSDTALACPRCESRMVQTVEARFTERFSFDTDWTIPRLQDRWCLDCGFRWASVLPPLFQAQRLA